MRRWGFFINTTLILLAVVSSGFAAASQFDIKATWNKEITNGVQYTHYRMSVNGAPVHAYLLSVDLSNPYVAIRPILAHDRLDSLETLPKMASRSGAFAAINGSYFNRKSSDPFPVGFLMIDGRTVYFSHQYRSAFGLTSEKIPLFGYPKTRGIIFNERTGEYFFLWGMNGARRENEVLVYTPEYGTRTGTNESGREITVIQDRVSTFGNGNSIIPSDGYVLSMHGSARQYLNWFQPGDRAKLYFVVDPSWLDVHNALTGGPLLIKGGRIALEESASERLYQGKNTRIPITAVGNTADGRLLLLVVDGRQRKYSVGLTYGETAQFMRSLGAVNAICMDGGGSSEMWISGATVNRPSDGGHRPISNGIGLYFQRQ